MGPMVRMASMTACSCVCVSVAFTHTCENCAPQHTCVSRQPSTLPQVRPEGSVYIHYKDL